MWVLPTRARVYRLENRVFRFMRVSPIIITATRAPGRFTKRWGKKETMYIIYVIYIYTKIRKKMFDRERARDAD